MPMKKKWKIIISIFLIGILLFYVIGQLISLKEPMSHDFPLSQVWKTHLKSPVVGLSIADENTLLVRTNASIEALDVKTVTFFGNNSFHGSPIQNRLLLKMA
jgi:hypothetical protein